MDSIAVTKPHMGVLPQERLPLSPFGVLAQAFAEDLLARGKQEEGCWSFVPLELLEEDSQPLPQPPTKLVFQVDLQLVLDALRRAGSRTEQQRTTERIVERILRLQRQREEHTSPKKQQGNQQSLAVLGTIHQEFHQNLLQNISVSTPAPIRPGNLQAPGALARQAEAFSRQLQTLREKGKSFAPASTAERTDAVQTQTKVPRSARSLPDGAYSLQLTPDQKQQVRALSQEALTLLGEQGSEAAQGTNLLPTSALLKASRQLEKLAADLPRSVQVSPHKDTASFRTFPGGTQIQGSASIVEPSHVMPGEAVHSRRGSTTERQKSPLPPAPDTAQQIRADSPGRRAIHQTKGAHIPSNVSSAPSPHTAAPSVQTLHTAAKDIRVNTEDPSHTSQEKPSLATQSPMELSHLTQAGERGTDLSLQAQHSTYTGQDPSPASPPAKQQAGAEAGKVTEPRFSAPSAPRSHGVSVLMSSARDIRLSMKPSHDDAQEPTPLPVLSPAELSFLSQTEGQEANISQQTQNPTHIGQVSSPVQPSAKQQAGAEAGKAADPQPNTPSAPRSHGVSGLSPAVRDIRLSTEPSHDDAQEPTSLPALSPTELSFLSQAEGRETHISQQAQNPTHIGQASSPVQPSAKQQAGAEAGKAADPQFNASSSPRSHSVSVFTPSTWDIRVSTANHPYGSPEGQLLSVPSPAELSYRTSREAPGSSPERGIHVSEGQGEGKQPSSLFSVPVHTPVTPRPHTILTAKTTIKDIRRTAVSLHGKAEGVHRTPNRGVTAPNTASVEAGTADQNRTPMQLPTPTDLILDQSGALPLESMAPMVRSETYAAEQNTQPLSPPGPISLTYGPIQRQREAAPPASAAAEQTKTGESDFVRSLPDWARRFLASGTDSGSAARTMGIAHNITFLPQPAPEEPIQWSDPNFRPPEAQIAYRQKEKGEPSREIAEVRVSDAELQRAADQVYHMIEDRIRRERRRLGL